MKIFSFKDQLIGGVCFIFGFTLISGRIQLSTEPISILLGLLLIYVGFLYGTHNVNPKYKKMVGLIALVAGIISALIAYKII